MTTKYLLPCCSCGRKIPVERPQAGETLDCPCGASLDVPTMLEMTKLERVELEAPGPHPASSWGVRQGMSLVGVVMLLIGLAGGGLVISNRPSPPPPLPGDEEIHIESQKLTPLSAWRIWRDLRVNGLASFPRQADENYEDAVLLWRLELGVVLAVVLVGAGVAGVPLLMKTKPNG